MRPWSSSSSVRPGAVIALISTVMFIGGPASVGSAEPVVAPVDWSMYHFSLDRSGVNPFETRLSTSNVGRMGLRWSQQVDDVIGGGPAVVDGVVYFGSFDGKLHARDARTGAVVWDAQIDSSALFLTPTVKYGMLYVGAGTSGAIYGVDAGTGQVVWKLQTSWGMYNDPAVDGGIVYGGGTSGDFYALDAFTGDIIWSTYLGSVRSDPAIVDGTIYVVAGTFFPSNLFALQESDGSVLWQAPLASYGGGSPAVSDGRVFVGTKNWVDGAVEAFDAATGAPLWYFGHPSSSTPAVWNDLVIVGSDADTDPNAVYALDAETGAIVWSLYIGLGYSSPAVANGVAYIGWASDYGDPLDGGLYALDAATGEVLGLWDAGLYVTSSPAVVDGWVYVGSFDRWIYAYSLGTGVSVSPDIAPPGTRASIKGRHFGASELVRIEVEDRPLAWIEADSMGRIDDRFTIPSGLGPDRHHLRAVGQTTGLAAEAFITARTDWSTAGFDPARSAWNPYENSIDPGKIRNLVDHGILWGGQDAPPLAVESGGIIVWVPTNFLEAVAADTRLDMWQVSMGADDPTVPTIAGATVLLGNADGLYAFDVWTGEQLWFHGGPGGLSPATGGGVAYEVFSVGVLSAIDIDTGTTIWEASIPVGTSSSAALAAGTIYVAGADGVMRAIEAATGNLLWRQSIGDRIERSSPSVAAGVVYGATADGASTEIVALDAISGSILWTSPVAGAIQSGLAVADGTVFAASDDGTLSAVDATTGEPVWTATGQDDGCVSTPAVANGIVYVANKRTLGAFDALTGSQLWQSDLIDGCGTPAVVNGRILIGDEDGLKIFEIGKPMVAPSKERPGPDGEI